MFVYFLVRSLSASVWSVSVGTVVGISIPPDVVVPQHVQVPILRWLVRRVCRLPMGDPAASHSSEAWTPVALS